MGDVSLLLILNPRLARGCLHCSAPDKRMKRWAASCFLDEPAAAEVLVVSAGSTGAVCPSASFINPPHRTPSSPNSLSLFPAPVWSVTKAGAEEIGLCVISAALFSAGGSRYARLAALWLAGSWGVFGCCAGKSCSRLLRQRAAGGFLNCGFITSNRCGFENFSFEAWSLFKRLWWKFALRWMCGKMVFSK